MDDRARDAIVGALGTWGFTPGGATQLAGQIIASLAEQGIRLVGHSGVGRIAAERQRQLDEEGWTPEHDDGHVDGEMIAAARCYLYAARLDDATPASRRGAGTIRPPWWPWHADWWRPSDYPIRNLEKAGALIAAEVDRLQRQEGTDA